MNFLEILSEFKALMKKWILSELVIDIIFVGFAVLSVLEEKTVVFIVLFVVFFASELLLIKHIFGSFKRFGDYLNLRGRYQSAVSKNDEAELELLENEITDYMKKDTEN